MLDGICAQIGCKMVSVWAKTSSKLHKMSGDHIESDSIKASFSPGDIMENCVEITVTMLQ